MKRIVLSSLVLSLCLGLIVTRVAAQKPAKQTGIPLKVTIESADSSNETTGSRAIAIRRRLPIVPTSAESTESKRTSTPQVIWWPPSNPFESALFAASTSIMTSFSPSSRRRRTRTRCLQPATRAMSASLRGGTPSGTILAPSRI